MRKLLTGLDANGRSCLVEGDEIAIDKVAGEGLKVGQLHATSDVVTGTAQWSLSAWEPGSITEMHSSDTVDYDLILAGSGELTLEDGVHPFEEGDVIVMTGVLHAWTAGPNGFLMSVVKLPAPRPA
jgi:quercetin dioxygenase-like cupin family protein